jgi:hypothetical protein
VLCPREPKPIRAHPARYRFSGFKATRTCTSYISGFEVPSRYADLSGLGITLANRYGHPEGLSPTPRSPTAVLGASRAGAGLSMARPNGSAAPEQRAAQVRGVLAEHVVVSSPLDPFLSLQSLAAYSSLSVRKLRGHLPASAHPLPQYRVGGKTGPAALPWKRSRRVEGPLSEASRRLRRQQRPPLRVNVDQAISLAAVLPLPRVAEVLGVSRGTLDSALGTRPDAGKVIGEYRERLRAGKLQRAYSLEGRLWARAEREIEQGDARAVDAVFRALYASEKIQASAAGEGRRVAVPTVPPIDNPAAALRDLIGHLLEVPPR